VNRFVGFPYFENHRLYHGKVRGKIHHLLNRGDRREPIFADDQDHRTFLDMLAPAG